jgi:NCS2 family nucleobase:cation symporter-2
MTQQNSMMQLSAVDEVLPFNRLLLLGLQHVLVMYAGDIAVPLIVSQTLQLPASETVTLINSSLFAAGIVTLIQCLGVWKFGARLPVMMGATFLSVAPMISIGLESHIGLRGYYGALLVSGALGILIAPLMAQILGLFPPVVSGSMITLLGLSLMGVAINWVGGGQPTIDRVVNGVSVTSVNPAYGSPQKLGLSILVLVVIVFLRKFGREIWRSLAPLVGMIIGIVVAIPLGEFHAPNLTNLPWMAFTLPFRFGAPIFDIGAIIAMTIVMLITLVESAAVFLALGEITGRRLTGGEMARAFRADGLGILVGGIFNAFPYTSYSQNVGLVMVTGVRSRYVCAGGGAILIFLGLLPKLGRFVAAIPQPVLGGAGLVMFGMVAANGIRTLSSVDFRARPNDLFIVAVSLASGLIPTLSPSLFQHLPGWISPITHTGIVLGSIVAFLLNLFFNGITAQKWP